MTGSDVQYENKNVTVYAISLHQKSHLSNLIPAREKIST